jgi:hypothetical protein
LPGIVFMVLNQQHILVRFVPVGSLRNLGNRALRVANAISIFQS